MRTVSSTRARLVAAALVLLLGVAVGCGGTDSTGSGTPATKSSPAGSNASGVPTPPVDAERSLCENANDYLWWVTFLGTGAQTPEALNLGLTIPKDPPRYRYAFSRPLQLAEAMVDQVPTDQRPAAVRAFLTWQGEGKVLAKYDFDPKRLPDSTLQQMADAVGQYQPSNTRYLTWLKNRCGTGSTAFPTVPDDARQLR